MPCTPPAAAARKDSIAVSPISPSASSRRSAGVAPSVARRASACGWRSSMRTTRAPPRAARSGRRASARSPRRMCAGIQRPAWGGQSGESELTAAVATTRSCSARAQAMRVGAARGHADDGEAAEAEPVGEVLDVGGEVGDPASRARVRAPEARTADRQVADAELGDEQVELGRPAHRRPDGAVQVEDGDAVVVAARRPCEPTAVGEGHGAFAREDGHDENPANQHHTRASPGACCRPVNRVAHEVIARRRARPLETGREVVGDLFERVARTGGRRASVAGEVGRDDPPARGQARRGPMPDRAARPGAVHEHEGIAGALLADREHRGGGYRRAAGGRGADRPRRAQERAGAAGSCTVTRSPPAARGVRVRVPSWAWVMLLTMARPRPTPAWSVRMRLGAALKRLGKRGDQLWGELLAGVLDREHHALGVNAGRDPHGALVGQVVDDRVVHEVRGHLQQERV